MVSEHRLGASQRTLERRQLPDRFTENRLIPFGVILRPHQSVDLRLYYLWRHTRGRTEWRDYSVIGAIATVSF